jgi:hypothetical protein
MIKKLKDRFVYDTGICTISWALIMDEPEVSRVGNARTFRWSNGAILVVLEDEVHCLEFPDRPGWIDVKRTSDSVSLGSANRERVWKESLLEAGLHLGV